MVDGQDRARMTSWSRWWAERQGSLLLWVNDGLATTRRLFLLVSSGYGVLEGETEAFVVVALYSIEMLTRVLLLLLR